MQHQYSLDLIQHEANGSVINQRSSDGYINATALCKAVGKLFKDYTANKNTKEFLEELALETGLKVQLAEKSLVEQKQALIETFPGAPSTGGGSWVHPLVAIHLGQWLSAKFAVMVSKWVRDWMTGSGSPGIKPAHPYHIQRHLLNLGSVPGGYFSILQEMTLTLIAPLEQAGYTLPEKLVPDISQGRMFCKHLRDVHGIDTDVLPQYMHRYQDGRNVPAKLYPESILGEFRRFLREEWLPKQAAAYFKPRAPEALPYLDRLPALIAPGKSTPQPAPMLKIRKRAA